MDGVLQMILQNQRKTGQGRGGEQSRVVSGDLNQPHMFDVVKVNVRLTIY